MSSLFYEVPIGEWPAWQQTAADRLHLKVIGLTHELFLAYGRKLRAALEGAPRDDEGRLTMAGLYGVMKVMSEEWRPVMRQWRRSFEAARWEASMIALGTVARHHLHYFGPHPEAGIPAEVGKAEDAGTTEEAAASPDLFLLTEQVDWFSKGWPLGRPIPWTGDADAVLKALEQRVYSDGFTLSQRIWRLDQVSLLGIQNTLYQGFVGGKSVWDIASALEAYLGAGQDCPRWTEERLKLTPAQIAAGDETGLLRGSGCAGKGVAYNALRLAVTEIQAALQAVLREILTSSPWVVGERLFLNDLHAVVYNCECEAITGYPPNRISDVMPAGTVMLPLHPFCCCYLLPELMSREEADDRLKRWWGGESWPELDDYLARLGLGLPETLPGLPPAVMPTSKRWLWWLLLLILAEAYRRWIEANEQETDQALGVEYEDWDEDRGE